MVSGGPAAALNAPIVQFGVGDFGFTVSQPASASAARRFLLQAELRTAGNCRGGWATDPAVVRTSDVDSAQSGAFGTPSETGGQASGSEPGRLEAPAAGEWLDTEGIFRQYHADLVRLALLLVGDRASAEDVVQDVFTRLCARGRELDQVSAPAYVRTAVVNGCRSVLRRRALARRIAITRAWPWRDTQESAEHTAILAEDRQRVLAALAALPARRREVLVLRFYLNLPVAEVAAILGISQGSVKSATARGLDALARRLGEER
jgi:RNA polymerase sigma factor (sigma-70 family)